MALSASPLEPRRRAFATLVEPARAPRCLRRCGGGSASSGGSARASLPAGSSSASSAAIILVEAVARATGSRPLRRWSAGRCNGWLVSRLRRGSGHGGSHSPPARNQKPPNIPRAAGSGTGGIAGCITATVLVELWPRANASVLSIVAICNLVRGSAVPAFVGTGKRARASVRISLSRHLSS